MSAAVPASDRRPQDDDVVPVLAALQWQQDYVVKAGSPVAALVLDAVMGDLRSGGPLGGLLPGEVRFGALVGLRLMATVHLLALERKAPDVAVHLPTLGGVAPADPASETAFRRAVVRALAEHAGHLSAGLASTPQTNETGRAALLRHALSMPKIADAARPVRLNEIGASAGLNLRFDHLAGLSGRAERTLPPVLERVGCDADPVDITTTEGRARLSSYVWVDDVERFTRLAAAIDTARRVPATLIRMDAADFCERLHLQSGTTTVLWHSAMWIYLDRQTAVRVVSALHGLGASATPDAPLLHVSWEWDAGHVGHGDFALVARRWDGSSASGSPWLLASGMSHGRDVVIVDPPDVLDFDPLLSPED